MEQNNRRVLAVYTVVEKPNGKDIWLRIGSAFTNRDASLSVLLDAIPLGGKLQIREMQPREHAGRDESFTTSSGPTALREAAP